MFDAKIAKQGMLFSALAVLYITVVTTFMRHAQTIVGSDKDNAFAPVVFLLLLVVSAATMGMLIFGKPVMLYLDGKKREAIALVVSTIGSLAIILIFLLTILVLINTAHLIP